MEFAIFRVIMMMMMMIIIINNNNNDNFSNFIHQYRSFTVNLKIQISLKVICT